MPSSNSKTKPENEFALLHPASASAIEEPMERTGQRRFQL